MIIIHFLVYSFVYALLMYVVCRSPQAVKKGQFSTFVWCGETTGLPLDQVSVVVDHVSYSTLA